MGYIFISYSHKDQDYAHELYKHLFEHGLDAWVDDRLDYGSRWPDEIERRVNECSAFVLVMSSNSRKSDWVQNELLLARKLNKPIYTLLLEGSNWWHLETIQYFDVRNEELPSTKFFVSLANVVSQSGSSPNISINVAGVVTGNIVVGNDNNVRSTIDAELEIAREKAIREAKEKADREAVEKAAREAAEQTAREKAMREAKEKAEREAAEKEAREKTIRDLKEKAERDARRKRRQELVVKIFSFLSSNSRTFAIDGLVIIGLIVMLFGGNYLLNNIPATVTLSTIPTILSSATLRPATVTFAEISSTATATPTLMTTPTLGIGSTIISEKDGMVLVYVPEGAFTMGSNDGNDYEKPEHQVTLKAFWIDQTEVTNAMYAKCVADSGACKEKTYTMSATHSSYYGNTKFDNYPVLYVDWSMANAYCSWAGRRLPTEAEWEKAARSTDARKYPWGEGLDCDKANYTTWCFGDASPVKSYPNGVSPYGAYDMVGNAWEWVNDWFGYDYYQGSPSSNPLGPDTGTYRVLRGGAWIGADDYIDSAYREMSDPTISYGETGFRCAHSP